ncbi:MAG: glycosyltransferase family 4 protein, partial [Thermoanaerobaculia bacterium]|nr:glycosyltransferase family 4 protein [Thermoanaerobaculia bacterium]
MICFLHGYLLEGSGSNLWTRSVLEALSREGHVVHLMAQENHPERYPFIREAKVYRRNGSVDIVHRGEPSDEAGCILHKPELGDPLPVYVKDRYEEFKRPVPMAELDDAIIEQYIEANVRVLRQIVESTEIDVIHANHAVLMSVVAMRIHDELGIPYVVMPHGSAIEYAVKRDDRMKAFAEKAFNKAERILLIGGELRERLHSVLPSVPDLDSKMVSLRLGVDTSAFEPVDRDRRDEAVEGLKLQLEGLERGKRRRDTDRLLSEVRNDPSITDLRRVFESTSNYELKNPDADLEEKLDGMDWKQGRTLLYVGRLIANKGPQNILAALPLVLEEEPDLRFVIVGHGPLREPLEAIVAALSAGNRRLVREIVRLGREIEQTDDGPASLHEWELFFAELERRGELESYFESAEATIDRDRVIFTGYLTHRELRFLFPCFDVAVFPSLVREAGPLVFLEALASGVFPLGTYFGGMKASIDSLSGVVDDDDRDLMKIDPEPDRLIFDLAEKLPRAMQKGDRWRNALRHAAVEHYDWRSVAGTLNATLEIVAQKKTAE